LSFSSSAPARKWGCASSWTKKSFSRIWDEVIRQGLLNSRELAVLATSESLGSEWVKTEWGAAWVLGRLITPIILRLNPRDLPDRLKQRQWIDFHKYVDFLRVLQGRG
jgi:hypothetical protein